MDSIDMRNIKADSKYQMLRVILEANLELMRMAESSMEEEKEIVTHQVLKGLLDFTNTLNKTFNIAKS